VVKGRSWPGKSEYPAVIIVRGEYRPFRRDPTVARRSAALFDEVAELYDRARPGYPAEVVEELLGLAGIGRGSRVLEVGPGTGQLTVPLARAGCEILAVERGPSLAAIARRRLAPFPRVRVLTTTFEGWTPPPEPFDVVVCAGAFHWLDSSVRVAKSVSVIREGGSLALVHSHHLAGGTREFFDSSQECYRRWFTDTPEGFRLPSAATIPRDSPELDAASDLEPAVLRRYEWEQEYTSREYLDLLRTYSDHRALGDERRELLLECLRKLIDGRFGGRVFKRHLTELRVARVRRRTQPDPRGGLGGS
jgi:SAM-dependent methyltransferase